MVRVRVGRHWRWEPAPAAAGRPGAPAPKMIRVRHGRHWRWEPAPATMTSRHGRHHAAATPRAAASTGESNGMCQSVRIHGEWVQRCHFPGQ
jgi:hypothetical protein